MTASDDDAIIERLYMENDRLRAENEELRAALKPFADLLATAEKIRPSHDRHLLWVETIDLRAAADALKDTKSDNK